MQFAKDRAEQNSQKFFAESGHEIVAWTAFHDTVYVPFEGSVFAFRNLKAMEDLRELDNT
jgi:molybdopterin-guanine dinucleotide biosynthesis protein A